MRRLPMITVAAAIATVHGCSAAGNLRQGLSNPSKMPGKGWSLPAIEACPTGAKLAKIAGTVCAHCYATGGNYIYPSVAESLGERFRLVKEAMASAAGRRKWVKSMAHLVRKQSPEVFRWHDSGDVFSVAYLRMIFAVCRATPATKHWLPTKELGMLYRACVKQELAIPRNLCIRVSAYKVGKQLQLPKWATRRGITTSSVGVDDGPQCPAPQQNGECRNCRSCWDRSVPNKNYPQH